MSDLRRGTKGLGVGGHANPYRGNTDEWLTPPEILRALGPFDLDPCAPIESRRPWPMAAHYFTEEDDGLTQDWFGRVWLNPPYGPQTGKWLSRLADHGNGIALTFARTETEMFHRQVWNRATGILFLEGRLYFYNTKGKRAKANAGGPSCLIAYGGKNVLSLVDSGIEGMLIIRDGKWLRVLEKSESLDEKVEIYE